MKKIFHSMVDRKLEKEKDTEPIMDEILEFEENMETKIAETSDKWRESLLYSQCLKNESLEQKAIQFHWHKRSSL